MPTKPEHCPTCGRMLDAPRGARHDWHRVPSTRGESRCQCRRCGVVREFRPRANPLIHRPHPKSVAHYQNPGETTWHEINPLCVKCSAKNT
jgi:hypothetical protein